MELEESAPVKPSSTSDAVADAGNERQRCLGKGSKDSTRTEIMVADVAMSHSVGFDNVCARLRM